MWYKTREQPAEQMAVSCVGTNYKLPAIAMDRRKFTLFKLDRLHYAAYSLHTLVRETCKQPHFAISALSFTELTIYFKLQALNFEHIAWCLIH